MKMKEEIKMNNTNLSTLFGDRVENLIDNEDEEGSKKE